MKFYGIIYLLIDGTNNKEYVGQTTRTLEQRFYEHKYGDQYIDCAIKKHGADFFATAILKECESKEEQMSARRRGETPFKNLLCEMDNKNLSFRGLAKLLGLSSLSDKIYGKQNFTEEQVAKLVEIFSKPAEYLMQRDET